MDFTVLSSTNLVFKNSPCRAPMMTSKRAITCVEHLEGLRADLWTSLNLPSKLNSLLLAQNFPDTQTKQLKSPIDCQLSVIIFYGPNIPENSTRTGNAIWQIKDTNPVDGLFKRLVCVCGGSKNIKANLELEMDDKIKLNFKDVQMWSSAVLQMDFNLSEMLGRKWGTKDVFSGILSLTLKLNEHAINRIYGGHRMVGDQVNRKLLKDAEDSGDTVILVGNGVQVKCHKAFLTAQSNVFKAMFNTEMQEAKSNNVKMPDITEAGLKALLAFLYCRDITEALRTTSTAVELLQASDKYGINILYFIMKDLVLDMENESFSVASAVQLLTLVSSRKEDPLLRDIEEKAKTVLKMKSDDELEKSEEFRNFFKNPDSGLNMFFYLRETK